MTVSTLTSAAGPRVLGDHRRTVVVDLGQREARVRQVGYLGEEREVAAGGLHTAFDDVARGHRTREPVVIVAAPAEVGGGRADDDRRVGHPPGDDDVGAAVEAVDDAPRTEIGVGRKRCAETELACARHQVVALDVGHLRGDAEPFGERPHRGRQARRVQAAGVGDDPHALVDRGAQALLELGEEGLGIAAVGRLGPVAGQDQHGQLGEIVAGEVVQFAAGQHFPHRREPVAVEPRTVADPDRIANGNRHAASSSPGSPTNR